jgi:hypothetical protein
MTVCYQLAQELHREDPHNAESVAAVGHLGCAHACAPIIVFCTVDRLEATLLGMEEAVVPKEALVVEVGPHGAFSVNSIGLNGTPFPLSFSVREASGSWMVNATAAQARELADVLMRAASDTIVVIDLATSSFLDNDNDVPWPPSRIAAGQGVSCQVHPLGALAAGVIGLSEEAIAMRREALPRFLDGWSPYELVLADMPGIPDPERTDEIVLALGTAAYYDEPVLPGLPGSCLLYSGHDDCYLHVESTDQTVPPALLSRLLALLAGSALAHVFPVEVPEPATVIAESLTADHAQWTGRLGAVSGDTVTISLSAVAAPWRLGHPLPERTDRTVIYDVQQGLWRIATVPGRG